MSKTNHSYRDALQPDLAQSLLNLPSEPPQTSAWLRLEAARVELAAAVAAANMLLVTTPLTPIVADHAMRLLGLVGFARICVDTNGVAMLEVASDAPIVVAPTSEPQGLPPIEHLRGQARALGLDPAPFGKAKTALIAAIAAAARGAAAVAPPVRPVKASPQPAPLSAPPEPPELQPVPPPPPPVPPASVSQPQVARPTRVLVPDHKQMIPDDDDDLTSLFDTSPTKSPKPPSPESEPPPPPGPPPPRRGVSLDPAAASVAPPRMPKGRSLASLVASAEAEVDIDSLLKTPAPLLNSSD